MQRLPDRLLLLFDEEVIEEKGVIDSWLFLRVCFFGFSTLVSRSLLTSNRCLVVTGFPLATTSLLRVPLGLLLGLLVRADSTLVDRQRLLKLVERGGYLRTAVV